MVEELAGVLWRKRRLRLAECAAYRRGLERATSTYSSAAAAAIAHLRAFASQQDVADAVQATPEGTASDYADLAADQAQTRQALAILEAGEDGAYEQAWLLCARIRATGGRVCWRNLRRMRSPSALTELV